MKTHARAAIVAVLFPVCASAQPVTIETTLQDRGLSEAIVLQGRATSGVTLPLPRGARMTNGRLIVDGQTMLPTLQRGSLSIGANGQAVEAMSLTGTSGLLPLQRSIPLRDDRLSGFGALALRFETDLRSTADACSDDVDPANSVTIFPTTRIAYDVDIGAVRSIVDAVALLPRRVRVQLPAQGTVSPEIATAALQLGILLTARGQEPRFDTVRGDDLVVVRLEPARNPPPGSPSIRIERKGNKLDIVIDPASDFVALERLLRTAPGALVGEQAAISRTPARAQAADDTFQAFSSLPPAQRIKRFGEWRLSFPPVGDNGRLLDSALLKLFITPDWSGKRPILTIYLNDQLVAAARPDPGETTVSVPLAAPLLRLTNDLRVTLERTGGERYCAATDQGQGAQILPGSGLTLGKGTGVGFARIATAFGTESQVVFPQGAAEPANVGPYLQLATKILATFRSRAGESSVVFGSPPAGGTAGTLRFEAVGPGGLVLPIDEQISGRDLRYEASSALAGLSAEGDGRTLLVQLTDLRNLPQPKSLDLGSGTRALIANSGVVWQNSATSAKPTAANQIRAFGEEVSSKTGIAIAIGTVVVIGLLLASRAILKSYFNRRRRKAE